MTFTFKLKGKDWIGLYLAVFGFYGIPLIANQFVARSMQHDPKNVLNLLLFFGLFAVTMLSILILITPILRRIIGNIYLGENSLKYSGKIGEFVLFNIGNLLLCLITLGIYFPWYLTKLWRYLLGKTTYNGNTFTFNGKGLHLLGLLIATVLFPMILYSVAIAFFAKGLNGNIAFIIVNQVVLIIIMVPYIYWIYKWMMNIGYKGYLIKWETQPIQAMVKLLKEILLTILTIGIYYPVALTKLYRYFIKLTTVSQQDVKKYSFNANFNYLSVWKIMWSQILLTIITLGIYGAWAYCKITALLVDNTSLIKTEGQLD